MRKRKAIGKKLFSLVLVVGLLLSCVSAVFAEEQKQVVKVGFYPLTGFHEYDSDGAVSGYDIEYLRKLAQYNDWKVSFAGVNSKEQAFELLDQGQLDIVSGIPMSPEYAAKYLYSAYPAGYTTEVIAVLDRNTQFAYEDFLILNGRPVGCAVNYNYKTQFLEYAQNNGFQPNLMEYANIEDARIALEKGEIDAIVTNIMELKQGEKITGQFEPNPFYYVCQPNKPQLIQEMDSALMQLRMDEPEFESALMKKYFPKAFSIPFTNPELAYANANQTLNIQCVPVGQPVLYQNGEQPGGIVYDILQEVSKESGIEFTYSFLPESANPLDTVLSEEKGGVVAGLAYSAGKPANEETWITIPFLKSQIVAAAKKGKYTEGLNVIRAAVPENYEYLEYLKKQHPDYEWKTYSDIDACFAAVDTGKADYVFQSYYQMQESLNHYTGLAIVSGSGWAEDYVLTLPADTDPLLVSVLNKSIRNVSDNDIEQAITQHVVSDASKSGGNSGVLVIAGAVVILAAGGAFLFVYIRKKQRQFKEAADEMGAMLSEKERLMDNITTNLNGGVIAFLPNLKCTVTYADAGFLRLIGYTRDEFEQNKSAVYYVHPEDAYIVNRVVASQQVGETVALELRLRHRNTNFIPVLLRGTMVKDEKDMSVFYCVVTDVTKQHRVLESLEKERERYSLLLEQFEDIIFDMDETTGRFTCSGKFMERFGWRPGTFPQEGIWDALRVFPQDIDTVKAAVRKLKQGGLVAKCKARIEKNNKEYEWYDMELSRVSKRGQPLQFIGKLIDVNQQTKDEEYNETLSERDKLTGLHNEDALQAAIELFLEDEASVTQNYAVVCIELDNFKSVNEKLGMPAGDIVLRASAGILTGIFGEENVVARIDGDEFCVFLQNMPEDILDKKIQQSCDGLCRSYTARGKEPVLITTSVGVYTGQGRSISYLQIMKNADAALHMAKIQGRNIVYYQETM